MSMTSEIRKTIKKIAFGETLLPQEFTLGRVSGPTICLRVKESEVIDF
jgi:hypothetical protein